MCRLERQFSDEYREAHGAGQRALFSAAHSGRLGGHGPRGDGARTLAQDARYAVRVYRRRTLVTTLALSALALAIGATTGVFSVLNAVLFRGLPFRDPARLVEVQEVQVDEDNGRAAFYGWRNGNAYLEDAAAYAAGANYTEMNLSLDAGSRRVNVAETSANFFAMLGTEVRFGCAFAADEDLEAKDAVAVIGYGLWQECFGGDPRVLGSHYPAEPRAGHGDWSGPAGLRLSGTDRGVDAHHLSQEAAAQIHRLPRERHWGG